MKKRRHRSDVGHACGLHVTRSESETRRLGARLAVTLPVPAVVLLRGSLGVGKTTLTRGIAEGLGFLDPAGVSSPSFTLVNVYPGRVPIYHVDLYRLTGRRDLRSVGLDDFIGRDGVTVVEWSERLPFSVEPAVIVELEDAGGDRRRIRVRRGVALRKGARGQARGVSRSGRQSSTGWRCRR